MGFELFFNNKFTEALEKLDSPTRKVAEKILKKIVENPLRQKPLHGEPGSFRARFSGYRIVYQVKGKRIIFWRLDKRDVVYK